MTLVLQVTQSTTAGKFPTVSAGMVNWGGMELAPQGNIFAFASTSTTFKDIRTITAEAREREQQFRHCRIVVHRKHTSRAASPMAARLRASGGTPTTPRRTRSSASSASRVLTEAVQRQAPSPAAAPRAMERRGLLRRHRQYWHVNAIGGNAKHRRFGQCRNDINGRQFHRRAHCALANAEASRDSRQLRQVQGRHARHCR